MKTKTQEEIEKLFKFSNEDLIDDFKKRNK